MLNISVSDSAVYHIPLWISIRIDFRPPPKNTATGRSVERSLRVETRSADRPPKLLLLQHDKIAQICVCHLDRNVANPLMSTAAARPQKSASFLALLLPLPQLAF